MLLSHLFHLRRTLISIIIQPVKNHSSAGELFYFAIQIVGCYISKYNVGFLFLRHYDFGDIPISGNVFSHTELIQVSSHLEA